MTAPAPAPAPGHAAQFAPVPIGVAPNGARRGRADHPALPLDAAALARDAAACAAAGASWFHVHVREPDGRHSLDPALYRDAFAAIRAQVGDALLLQMTTEAAGRYQPAQQIAAVRALRPRAVSIAVRELLASADDYAEACALLRELAAEHCAVQFIAYARGDVERLRHWLAEAAAALPVEVLLVLGAYVQARDGQPAELLPLLGALESDWGWSVCAFGPGETACLVTAAALGGGVRVGFENNLWLPDGRQAADNAELVGHLVDALARLGLRPATAAQTRARFARR